MNYFFSKKIFYFSAILFFAFLFVLAEPKETLAQQNCDLFPNGSNEQLNCIADENNPDSNIPENPSIILQKQNACEAIEDKGSNEYLYCIADLNDATYKYNAYFSEATEAEKTSKEELDCSAWGALAAGNAMRCTTVWFGNSALWLSSWFLDLASVLLNQSILFNLNIADFIQKTPGINLAWGTIRDMSNIIFIFALLWISIQNILQIGDGKKLIPSIIIAALLINFSLFFTKVIIDTSNIVAFQFYSGIIDPAQTGSFSAGGISDKFFQLTKIQSVFASNSVDFFQILTISLMGVIFILITAFSFLSVAFIFLSRAIILILLLPLSPFAYVAGLIPKTAKYSKMWWDELLNQVLVAPVFLMFMWMILIILGGGNNDLNNNSSSVATTEGMRSTIATYTENTNLAAALTASGGVSSTVATYTENVSGSNMASALTSPDVNTVGVIFSFLIAIGLLLAAVKVTRELSGSAGSKISGMLSVGAGALAGGAGGYMARNTVGLAASRLARSEKFQEYAGRSLIGEYALKGTRGLAAGSFDVRNAGETPLIGGLGSKLAGTTGAKLDLGSAGGKGGFNESSTRRTKEKTDFGKSLDRSASGRTAFARRTATSTLGLAHPASITIAGSLGRDNRMSAAQIFKDRVKEIDAELRELRNEENVLQNISNAAVAGTGRPMTASETNRLTVEIPADRLKKEDERAEMAGGTHSVRGVITGEIADLGLSSTLRQQY